MYTINENDDRRVMLDGATHAAFETGQDAAWYVVAREQRAALDVQMSGLATRLEELQAKIQTQGPRVEMPDAGVVADCSSCIALTEQVQALLAEQAAAASTRKGRRGGAADPNPGSGPPPQNAE